MSETIGERIEKYKAQKEIVETAKKGIKEERRKETKEKISKAKNMGKSFINKFASGATKLAKKKKKVVSRRILRHQQLSVTIPADAGRAPYVPIFMKSIVEQEKRNMFFS